MLTGGATPAANTLRFDGSGSPSNIGFALDDVRVVGSPELGASLTETLDTGDTTAQTTSVTLNFIDPDLAQDASEYTATVVSVGLVNSNNALRSRSIRRR